MPKLEEGNLWIRATLPTSISLERSASYVGEMRRILADDARLNPRYRDLLLRHYLDGDTAAELVDEEVARREARLGRPLDAAELENAENLVHRTLSRARRALRELVVEAGLDLGF
jgi:DNA-directed RNA polymerase specialized sigma24 family protein